MVLIEELYSIGQRSIRWKILNRQSRLVNLRWAEREGFCTVALLKYQHRTWLWLLLLSTAEYPAPGIRQIGKMLR